MYWPYGNRQLKNPNMLHLHNIIMLMRQFISSKIHKIQVFGSTKQCIHILSHIPGRRHHSQNQEGSLEKAGPRLEGAGHPWEVSVRRRGIRCRVPAVGVRPLLPLPLRCLAVPFHQQHLFIGKFIQRFKISLHNNIIKLLLLPFPPP